jgi:hypothetical protein
LNFNAFDAKGEGERVSEKATRISSAFIQLVVRPLADRKKMEMKNFSHQLISNWKNYFRQFSDPFSSPRFSLVSIKICVEKLHKFLSAEMRLEMGFRLSTKRRTMGNSRPERLEETKQASSNAVPSA